VGKEREGGGGCGEDEGQGGEMGGVGEGYSP
jgi:hypothetical protein